jgi:succinyl-CoA synthetase beta subunit
MNFSKSKIAGITEAMLGNKLITKQTPPNGVPVNHVMIAESVDIFEEKYLCFILDRLVKREPFNLTI